MLTLKDFVKETLTQIAEATHEFEEDQKEKPGDFTTNPVTYRGEDLEAHGVSRASRGGYITIVDFDVAVTSEDAETSKGGGALTVVSVFKVEGGVETQAANSSISRVRFKMPLGLG